MHTERPILIAYDGSSHGLAALGRRFAQALYQ
jgi:hypothetical protein